MAISAATRVAALKKVDFPVFGLPITPNNREYDLCIETLLDGYFALLDAYIICCLKGIKALASIGNLNLIFLMN